jgi:ubiquinone biosynthesis monooxygenase Coq6
MPNNSATLVWSTIPTVAQRLKSLPPAAFVSLVNAAFTLNPVDLDYITLQTPPEEIQDEVTWRLGLKQIQVPKITKVEANSIASFPLKMRHANSYTDSNVALIGYVQYLSLTKISDAAHTMHPLAGQGLNQGLVDVEALVDVLSQALHLGQDIGSPHVLQEYARKRYFDTHLVQGVVDKLHKLYSLTNPAAVYIRSWGLELVNEMDNIKRLVMKAAS